MCDEKTFEELVDLFKEDPVAFDTYKQERIEQRIAELCTNCPDHVDRCLRFQWRIDRELSKYKNPIARYNAMVTMFWKGVEEFKHANTKLPKPANTTASASILDFNRKE